MVEGVNAGLDASCAGNTAGDVALALNAKLIKNGIHREGICGYPIGLSYPIHVNASSFYMANGYNCLNTWDDLSFYARPMDGRLEA